MHKTKFLLFINLLFWTLASICYVGTVKAIAAQSNNNKNGDTIYATNC